MVLLLIVLLLCVRYFIFKSHNCIILFKKNLFVVISIQDNGL